MAGGFKPCAADDVRRLALALPHAYEDSHRRAPAFRVQTRIFAMLREAPPRLIVKMDREDQLNMIEGHGPVVRPGPHYSWHGWTEVDFPNCDQELLAQILRLAWTHVAPRRLVTGQGLNPRPASGIERD
ncbi:MAG: MmcQ/YjbR family DNA-binding protein [Caulobacteraceae bacterium]|nr:MmcQ/YjbR family DNA-binding protein [Caulobacteraceae bacterium]